MRMLELDRLSKAFPAPQKPLAIVHDFSLKLARAELWAFIAHSGCGKSTGLSMVEGLSNPTTGAISEMCDV